MKPIKKVAVIGSGTMGAAIAAQFVNAGLATILFDIAGPDGDRNKIVKAGRDRAASSKPASFMRADFAERLELGNLDDDFAKLGEVDWVIEAIVEKLEVKADLLARLETVVSKDCIVSSNSSGIPMKYQSAKLGADLKPRFLGTHFFNPPRYLHLLEIIPTRETSPEVIARVAELGDRVLGKGIVRAHDVPGFAANRIGAWCTAKIIQVADELKLSPDVVDTLTGPILGRPKSATYRTIDVVGLDIFFTVCQQLEQATKEGFGLPAVFQQLLDKGWLGNKSGQGFYQKSKDKSAGSKILTLNAETLEYEDKGKVRLEELASIIGLPTVAERAEALLKAPGWVGEFTRRTVIPQIHFAASKVGKVADTAADVDNAVKWGFGWEVGPLELADALGRDKVRAYFGQMGLDTPEYFQTSAVHEPATRTPGPLRIADLRNKVCSNESATLWDAGDGVALLEFHTKANAIGEKVLEMFDQAHHKVLEGFQALVVGNEGENFCAGADLNMLYAVAESGQWDEIRKAVRVFQNMTKRLRYAPYPVVTAAHKMTLGGGLEVALWSDAVVASAELYTGLVEVGVGILPAGGGTTEMVLRKTASLLPGADPFIAVQQAFELIAMAKVSTSAFEAQQMGFLRPSDKIVMNSDRVLDEAKIKALQLVPGYVAPAPRKIEVLGEAGHANLRAGAMMMAESGFITEYEVHLATVIGEVLCGGKLNRPETVSEDLLLDLEVEAFVKLCGQEKTRQRLGNMLKTGKPLRN